MRLSLLPLVLCLYGCAVQPVTLDLYRGVYTTHFEGIPDESRVCAVISNHGEKRVSWVRLRLRATSRLGEVPGRWTSHWLYEGPIEPGDSVAVELREPPVADQIELDLRRWGSSRPSQPGRQVTASDECSLAALEAAIRRDNGARTAEIRIVAAGRVGEDVEGVLLAADD